MTAVSRPRLHAEGVWDLVKPLHKIISANLLSKVKSAIANAFGGSYVNFAPVAA